jgi:hypothetical protein
MTRRPTTVAVALVVAAVAILGLPASATSASRKADVALARKALIVKSDLPSGWTASPSGANSGGPNIDLSDLAKCLGVAKSVVNYNAPEADSPSFNDNNTGQSVQDEVDVYPSLKIAAEQFNSFASSRTPGCIQQFFNEASSKILMAKEVGKGAKVGNATAVGLATPVASNQSSALKVQIPITYKGVKLTIVLELVTIMSKSKTEGAQLTIGYPDIEPFAQSLVAHLEAVTVQRLG